MSMIRVATPSPPQFRHIPERGIVLCGDTPTTSCGAIVARHGTIHFLPQFGHFPLGESGWGDLTIEPAWGGKERCACSVLGDTTQISVRALTRADEPQWRRLWTEYLRFYESAVDEEVYLTTFERLLSGNEPQHCFVAEANGEAVGLVHFLYHRHNWRIEDVCYLQDLYADPEVRGLGVGRALIEAVYEAADRNGTPVVYWNTQEFNTTARRLYDRIAEKTPFIKYQRGIRT